MYKLIPYPLTYIKDTRLMLHCGVTDLTPVLYSYIVRSGTSRKNDSLNNINVFDKEDLE